jgi:hypothetical protein
VTQRYRKDERVRQEPVANAASNERDELWELSVAKDRQRKRQDLDTLRLEYHTGQADRHRRTLSQLVAHHQNEARKLSKGGA